MMLLVLLETGYLNQTMKKHLSLIGNHRTRFCTPSVGEEKAAKFESVFTAVRYIYSQAQLKK